MAIEVGTYCKMIKDECFAKNDVVRVIHGGKCWAGHLGVQAVTGYLSGQSDAAFIYEKNVEPLEVITKENIKNYKSFMVVSSPNAGFPVGTIIKRYAMYDSIHKLVLCFDKYDSCKLHKMEEIVGWEKKDELILTPVVSDVGGISVLITRKGRTITAAIWDNGIKYSSEKATISPEDDAAHKYDFFIGAQIALQRLAKKASASLVIPKGIKVKLEGVTEY
jgi:hypothetical protein